MKPANGGFDAGFPGARGRPRSADASPWRWLLLPFERFRSLLREIDYHSARRTRSRWTHLSDLWILLSLPAAIAAVMLLAILVRQRDVRVLVTGTLEQEPGGALVANVVPPGRPVPTQGRFISAVEVVQERRLASWPVPLWSERDAARLRVLRGAQMVELDLRGDDDEAVLVRRAMAKHHPEILGEAADPGRGGLHLATFAAATAVTWVALMPLGLLAIQVLRAGASLASGSRERRRRRMRRSHRCPECGYDLHGSDFSARCPECGAVLS